MTLSILAHFAVRLAKAVLIATGTAALFNAMDGLQGGNFVEGNTVLVFFLIVALITALQLALDMLPTHCTTEHVHIVRDNRMPTIRQRPSASFPRLEDTPPMGYQMVVKIDDPFQDCALTRQRLRMMVHTLLANHNGHASNNYLPGYTEVEVRIFREWLLHRGYATKVRGSAILTISGRVTLQNLLPSLGS